jgi:hypothetical protein
LCGLMISEMTLSNQSHLPQFFSPWKMTYQNLANSGLRQAGIGCSRKMTYGVNKSWEMTYRGLADSGWSGKPESARPR